MRELDIHVSIVGIPGCPTMKYCNTDIFHDPPSGQNSGDIVSQTQGIRKGTASTHLFHRHHTQSASLFAFFHGQSAERKAISIFTPFTSFFDTKCATYSIYNRPVNRYQFYRLFPYPFRLWGSHIYFKVRQSQPLSYDYGGGYR